LQSLGYEVYLNIMQIHQCSAEDIESISTQVESWNCVSILYFADSLGSLNANQIEKIVQTIKKKWHGKIGFHAHNNCNNALDNTMKAYELGCTSIDATVNGMGRGAGNTPTEMLLIALHKNGTNFEYLHNLFDIVLNDFSKLKEKYKWGGGLLYQLSALKNVHPSYIQQIISNATYDTNSILDGIDYLSNNEGYAFSDEKLHKAYLKNEKKEGSTNLSGYFSEKNILIIGPGNSVDKHKEMLELLIEKQEFLVLSTSFDSYIREDYVDYYISSDFLKNYSKINEMSCINKKFIAPKSSLYDNSIDPCLLDYELMIEEGVFEIFDKYVKISTDKSLLYALAVAYISDAKEIYLAGFDGHSNDDIRFKEVSDALLLFENRYGYSNIHSLTYTRYSIPHKSMYEPWN